MENPYRIIGDTVEIDLIDRHGTVHGTTLVDIESWPKVNHRKWSLNKQTGYVQSHGRAGWKENVYLHRLICGTHQTRWWTDHRNGNKLDIRSSNLRKVSARLSNINKRTKRGELRGIYQLDNGRWQAQISISFDTLEEAKAWRLAVAKLVHGTQFIEDSQNLDY